MKPTKIQQKAALSTTSGNKTRVLLIDANSTRASVLKRALIDYGYELVAKLADAQNLLEDVATYTPDVIVVGIELPDKETLAMIGSLTITQPHPVVMFAEKDAPHIIQHAVKAGVSAYIVDDIQPQRIQSIITVAIARFKEHQSLRLELEKTKGKLEERKLLEKAKGLLMKTQGLAEEEAYASLRKMAMDKRQSLSHVAENVIDVLSRFKAS